MKQVMVTLVGSLCFQSASAMCGGMFVPSPSDSEVLDPGIFNNASEVVVLRQNNRTTLTLSNDYFGDFSEFAIVMPIPEGIQAENVSIVEPAPIQKLRQLTAPRLNHWKCSDFNRQGCNGGFAMSSDFALEDGGGVRAPGAADANSVDVEAEFSVGEFDIRVLSSEDSSGLLSWLRTEGLGVPTSAEPVLQAYIDAGTRFMVAEVDLGQLAEGQEWLSPLQITYEEDAMMIPIRMGAINSTGLQHVFFNVFTSYEEGRVAISNYPEMDFDAGCMLADGETLESAYFGAIEAGVAEHGGATWLTEYTGFFYDDMTWAGYENAETEGWSEHFYTRLHLAVTPEAATKDVSLYATNMTNMAFESNTGFWDATGIEFTAYNPKLWDRFRFCGADEMITDLAYPTCGELGLMTSGCSVSSGAVGWGISGLLIFAMYGRRRRD